MPPRHGKSTLCSHFFPAWYLGCWPEHRVILTGHTATFTAGWSRKVRDTIGEWGRLFGVQVRGDLKAADEWELEGHSGGMKAAGVGGNILGRGANVLIIDDPVKDAEEALSVTIREKQWAWYQSTAETRMEPNAVELLIMHRWHRDDLGGRILASWAESPVPYEIVRLPALAEDGDVLGRELGAALWPERFPVAVLEEKRRKDPYWWHALYQQNPVAEGGVEWPADWFDHAALWFDAWPPDSELEVKTLGLDPSKGSDSKVGDFSAYTLYARHKNGLEYVEADLCNRRDAMAIVAHGVEHVRKFSPDGFAIEANAFQDLFAPLFRDAFKTARVETVLHLLYNAAPKQVRIRRLTSPLSDKRVRFRRTPGTRLLVKQLQDWPIGLNDDGPDSFELSRRLAIQLSNQGGDPAEVSCTAKVPESGSFKFL